MAETAAASESGRPSRPTVWIRPVLLSIPTIRLDRLPSAAPLPPTISASPPYATAAAWVVGAGRRPRRTTRFEPGVYSKTASLAVPSGFEPPAMKTLAPTLVTAAYRTGVGRCATTRPPLPGLHVTIVSSQCDPVNPPTTYAVSPITAAA